MRKSENKKPPYTNRGVEITKESMEENNLNHVTFSNGLSSCVDWIEFTVELDISVSDILNRIGLDISSFDVMEKGGYGYRSCLRHSSESVLVYYNGNDGMGVHIRVTGSAVSFVLCSYRDSCRLETPFSTESYNIDFRFSFDNILPCFLDVVLSMGHLTRLDLAIDDIGANYFTTQGFLVYLEKDEVVSQFRTFRNVMEKRLLGGCVGHTIYLGSRKSEVMLRIYDKQLEQSADFPWVRWELELKGRRADSAARSLIERQCIGSVCMGILGYYVRIVKRDNINASRCTMDKRWEEFLNSIEPLRLSVAEKECSVEKKQEWINKQVLPTLAGLSIAYGGDLSFMDLSLQIYRIKSKDLQMYQAYSKRVVVVHG